MSRRAIDVGSSRRPPMPALPFLNRSFYPVEPPSDDTRARLDPDWLKDTDLKDVTVIFGPNNEHRLDAHRLVLRNSIEWFNRASENFSEAKNREITLYGDDPDAVRTMLNWAYNHDYKDGIECNAMTLTKTKALFIRHLRVFVVADKYFAKGLDTRALDCLGEVVRRYVIRGGRVRSPSETLDFVRFAVEEVFVYQTCFRDADGTSGNVPSSSTTYDATLPDAFRYIPESLEDFFRKPTINGHFQHPIDRVQTSLVRVVLELCRPNNNPEFNKSHLQAFVAKLDGFAEVLAREMLDWEPRVFTMGDR